MGRFDFSPRHVLDVGANHGNWTRAALEYFPDAQYTLLEPQDHPKVHIQDLIDAGHAIRWINAGASDQSGELPFHISHRDDSSTFVAPRDNGSSGATFVKVMSLDDLLVAYRLPVPEMVKIEAEGLDLKVLRGARKLLGQSDVVLLEASVSRPCENSVVKAINLMNDHGYRLIDITELNRSPKYGVLWLAELAFLRNASPLFASATTYE